MKLQTKMITSILAVFIISLLFMGVLVFSNSRANLEQQIINQLQSASKITENNINTFLDQQENKIELVATQSALSNEELSQMVALDGTFYDMFVIDSNGMVVTSSNPERVGLYRGDREYFVNARNQTYTSGVYFALVPQQYSVSVSTPFNEGVLVGAMNLDVFDKLVSDRAGLGKTGENLLAFDDGNGSIIYFTTRLFSEQKIEILSNENAKSRPIYPAVRGEERVFTNVRDYRNQSVLASTNYISRVKMGMVSKIDISEAFSKVGEIQSMTWFLVAITSILVGFVVYIISKGISNEIKDITEDIGKITKGDLEIQLKKSGLFEIQSLIDSLNRILASMKLAILRTGFSKAELGIGEAVKAKEEAEQRFKILYESSADAMMTLEPPTWKFTAGNPATLKMFNVKDEKELQNLSPGDLSPEKQPDGHLSSVDSKKMIEKAMKEGSAYFEWTHRRYNGENFHASVLLTRIESKGKIFLQATVRDITKDKKTDEEMRFNSEILKNISEGVYLVGLDDVIIKYANPKFEKMFGYKPGEMIGKHASIVNAPTDKNPKETAREIMAVIRKAGSWHGEVNNIKKDGTKFWCHANVSVMEHPKYDKVLVAVHEDITEQKKAEEAIAESENKYKIIVESATDQIFMIDENYKYLSANKVTLSSLRKRLDQIIGKSIFEVYPRKVALQFSKNLRKVFQTGKELVVEEEISLPEHRVRVSTKLSPIKNSSGKVAYVLGVVRDITGEK